MLLPELRLMSNKEGILVLPLIRVLFGILFLGGGGFFVEEKYSAVVKIAICESTA